MSTAILACLTAASPAIAGQYTVTFNANANTQPGCGIWSMSGSLTFAYNPPCSTWPLGFSGGGNGSSLPAGARIGIQTVAPAGVAITSASVSPWYIYDINNGQGWGGGSYYAGGGSQWHDSDTWRGTLDSAPATGAFRWSAAGRAARTSAGSS